MNILCLIVFTSNVLGSFNDPFEFEGDYGKESNHTRQLVFEKVVSKEALAKHASYESTEDRKLAITNATLLDQSHGPTLSELITPELLAQLQEKVQTLHTSQDFQPILEYIGQNQDKKLFYFLRNNPSDLLSLDKILRDKAAREGKAFDLPILSSTATLTGQDQLALKSDLLDKLFTPETLAVTKPQAVVKKTVEEEKLHLFTTPVGQIFFYWLYQSLNLHLLSEDMALIDSINKVKSVFAETLGDPIVRAHTLKQKLLSADAGVLFTQESDNFVPEVLLADQGFHDLGTQNRGDGTLVFLRSDLWESDFEVLTLDSYEGFAKGRLNVVLATNIQGEKFILASAHGNSTRAEDGRLQISLIKQLFDEQKESHPNLQLIIGIDANTKSEEDVEDLMTHLEDLGLTSTHVGPTTIKQRMVTAQHGKVGKFAIDEEDYLIVLKPEHGGQFTLEKPTVGFKTEKPDPSSPLPNLDNLSDHYPVGAELDPI